MPSLDQNLTPGRTIGRAPGASKKRPFETVAEIICAEQPTLPHEDVLDRLIARKKPGSTGVENGIAIIHCRVSCCTAPIGTLVTLEKPIPFDAPDDKPVNLLFVLLVPEEANQQYLQILASIARPFSQEDFCQESRNESNNRTLYDIAHSRAS